MGLPSTDDADLVQQKRLLNPVCAVLNWSKMVLTARSIVVLVAACVPVCSGTHDLSMYVWLAARSADMVSSLRACQYEGVRESNPLVLGTSDGRFTTKTLVVQSAITAVSVAAQRYAVRKWPKSRRLFIVLNFSGAGLHTYATVHNVMVIRTMSVLGDP